MKLWKNAVISFISASMLTQTISAVSVTDKNNDGITDIFDSIYIQNEIVMQKNDMTAEFINIKREILGLQTDDIPEEYPIDESAILEPKGTVHTGDGTFYGGGYVGGCAMLDPVDKDRYWIVAMNIFDYNNAQLAGAYIEVTGVRGTINMLVTDLLPEGKKGDLDLYVDAFPLIADPVDGRVPVSWKIVPLDTDEPVSYRFKEGSTEFWCGVQVRNHKYPIAKLAYLNDEGEWIELPRRNYNYFESMEMGAGPFTFKITDIYGDVIVDKDIPMILDEDIPGSVQFPE
ncbi:MAG: expansin EXLX1 family cellulose-binding protein [Oscillospiraceae bacterium]